MNHKNNSQRVGFKVQRGGFVVGLIIGLLIGLALSLGVALYVTKVPVPFVNKVPQRNPAQDAAEAEKNKNWDPNSPLYGKNPAKPNSAASDAPAVTTAPTGPAPVIPGMPSTTPPSNSSAAVPAPKASAPVSTRDPAAILADRPSRSASAASGGGGGGNDPFTYFVQAGAYGRTEDAEAQRAKIALLGMDAKLTEREQSGKTVYRVRVGPYDKRADADAAKAALDSAGVEAALVRVQRSGTP
jgi:cell division protein FtsN